MKLSKPPSGIAFMTRGSCASKVIKVGNTHVHQLLQSKCAVERLTFGALMLSSFINERHDYVDPVCFSRCSSDDTFQILIMVIR